MSWLDAHESYVMEIIVRDRVDELRSAIDMTRAHIEPTTVPAAVVPEARDWSAAGVALCPCAFAKASR